MVTEYATEAEINELEARMRLVMGAEWQRLAESAPFTAERFEYAEEVRLTLLALALVPGVES